MDEAPPLPSCSTTGALVCNILFGVPGLEIANVSSGTVATTALGLRVGFRPFGHHGRTFVVNGRIGAFLTGANNSGQLPPHGRDRQPNWWRQDVMLDRMLTLISTWDITQATQ